MPYDRSVFVTRTPQEDICFDFMQEADAFIADSVFTPKPVKKAETKVFQMDTSKLRLVETRKATNSEADLVDEQLFSRNVTLVEHKLGAEINPRDLRDADIPQMLSEARKVKLVTQHLLIKRESLAATLATTSTNYPSDLTSAIASGSRWNETGGDPEADKVTADTAIRARCGRSANALAIDISTLDKLRLSPAFRSRVQYTNAGPVSDEHIKAFFKIDYLFVGKARYDSAIEGTTPSIGATGFWGDNAIFFVYNPGAALEDCSYGHMYMMEAPFWTETTEDPKRRGAAGKMKRVEVGTEYVLSSGIIVSSSDSDFAGGYLFRTVVA